MDKNLAGQIEAFSNFFLKFNFAAVHVIVIGILIFLIIAGIMFVQSYYRLRLIARASQQTKNLPVIFSAIAETLGKLVNSFCVSLPLVAGVLLAAGTVFGITTGLSALNEFFDRERQIKELSIAINFLNQSDKVLDVRIRSVEDGITTLQIAYKASDPADSSVPPVEWTKEITLSGTEIHFDCLVFNFSYSEVGSGRQRNIAIPYRVFSNTIPARAGINLYKDTSLIPDEDDYGFIPPVYREQLVKLLTDPQYSSSMGIRSVNGSDVWHRDARPGDRLRIKVEQTGGITLEIVTRGAAR
ncbi:hypothetical protein FACS1894172_08940 [Spirochaetia bacterium]|nr:hypothetical protein FACS1894172_08940 [Spirochaetia bacterium]